jgi:prevent-host-death family protein
VVNADGHCLRWPLGSEWRQQKGFGGERSACRARPVTATLCSNMESLTIPQRELRNNIGEVLRRAEAGTEYTITVRGRPVARLGPADRERERRLDVDRDTVRTILARTPVDGAFASDIATLRAEEAPVGDPWDRG